MKQRVLRDDEDPLTGVKNFENFALFCRNKEREDGANKWVRPWITGWQASRLIWKESAQIRHMKRCIHSWCQISELVYYSNPFFPELQPLCCCPECFISMWIWLVTVCPLKGGWKAKGKTRKWKEKICNCVYLTPVHRAKNHSIGCNNTIKIVCYGLVRRSEEVKLCITLSAE